MARANPTKSIKIDATLADRVSDLVKRLPVRTSFNLMCETLIDQMVELIESPKGSRVVPVICKAIDDAADKPIEKLVSSNAKALNHGAVDASFSERQSRRK